MVSTANLKVRVVIILALTIASAYLIWPLDKKINQGLDLKGGTYVLLHADTSGIKSDKLGDAISGAIEKIRTRIDAYGVKETTIQVQGVDSILAQLPGVVDRSIIDKLKEAGKLEFKIVDEDKDKFEAAIKGNVTAGCDFLEYQNSWLLVGQKASLTGADLAESYVGFDNYGAADVKLQFTSQGMKQFARVTEENVGKRELEQQLQMARAPRLALAYNLDQLADGQFRLA